MTRFATFAVLYMVALFLEPAELWRYPSFTGGLLLLGCALLAVGPTRRNLPLFLVAATLHPLLLQFPDVPNHVNVEIYCSLILLTAIGYSLARSRQFPTDDDCFELVRPVLQSSMILIYVLAGFAKLNTDFFNSDVSCVGSMVEQLANVATRRTLGIPTAVLFGAGGALIIVALVSGHRLGRSLSLALRLGLFGVLVLPAVLALHFASRIPSGAAAVLVMSMAGVVILWELVGGLMLAVPRFQGLILAFGWMMHATLSLIGFVHFGGLAFALLFTFLPARYLDLTTTRVRVPMTGWSIPRPHVYFTVCVLAGIVSGLRHRLAAGMLFNLGTLILIWPILNAVVEQLPRPTWPGVSLNNRLTPRWMFAFPVLLLLHGLTSYLGLRTAGNFTMFSNLRTEGPRSNHFLLGGNPLKLWGYQEDVVRVTRIDDSVAKLDDTYQPMQGVDLPVVEFRKRIDAWTAAGTVVPMTFEYRGRVQSTGNIVTDPVWRSRGRNWEMRLLDFRVIQPQGPNRCRW